MLAYTIVQLHEGLSDFSSIVQTNKYSHPELLFDNSATLFHVFHRSKMKGTDCPEEKDTARFILKLPK